MQTQVEVAASQYWLAPQAGAQAVPVLVPVLPPPLPALVVVAPAPAPVALPPPLAALPSPPAPPSCGCILQFGALQARPKSSATCGLCNSSYLFAAPAR